MRSIDADALKNRIISQSNTGRESYPTELICEFIDEQQTVNDWIPADKPPEVDESGMSDYILLSFENFSTPLIGRYELDKDGGGAYYVGDSDRSCISTGLFVNAWMPLPEPYKD